MIIGPTSHKGEVFGGLGLRWHKRTFFHMPSSTGLVYPHHPLLSTPGASAATPRVPMGPQTCWKSCATLPWKSWTLLVALKLRPLRAEAARCQLDQFERSKLRMVPRVANLVAMFGQFVETLCFFFPMLKAIVTAVSLTTFGNVERPKMWTRQLQIVGLTKVTCKRSSNKLPSFYPPQSPCDHSRCFGNDTKGADGAGDLLEVLSKSPLEKLHFEYCSQIPSSAWQRVPSGAWPALRDAPGIPEEELSRIVSGGAADGSFCRGRLVFASDSGRASEPWVETCLF